MPAVWGSLRVQMNAHRSPSRSTLFTPAKRVLVALAVLLMAACDTNAVATYVTKDGDTVDGIAARFGVPRDTVIERNGLKQPYKLRPGMNLALPGARVVDTTTARVAPPSSAPPSSGSAPPIGRVDVTELPPPSGTPTPPASVVPTPPASAAPPPPADAAPRMAPPATALSGAAPRFAWPLRGRTLASFGPRSGGQQNDGIDIAAPSGTPVKAADGGTVVYSGSEVRGLGNLLLVSHAGGYITAYAHLDKLSVAKGATVKKGQTIGTVGTSGGVSEPQLHFEIRHRNKPVDPAGLLPR